MKKEITVLFRGFPKSFIRGFSLIELMISLIVISCVAAAFAPVVTKKLKNSSVSVSMSQGSSAVSEITTECSDGGENYGPDCKLCTKTYCIQCGLSTCATGKYIETKTCTCKDCSANLAFGSNGSVGVCLECDSTKCTKCNSAYYILDGKCTICPSDKICDGINAYDKSYCDNPPSGYFCDGTTPRKCTEKYSSYCSTCDSSACKTCQGYYYLDSNKNCVSCNMTACTQCTSTSYCTACQGDWVLDTSQHKCSMTCGTAIANCLYCSNASTCTSCYGGYYVNSSKTCTSCSTISNCISCSNGSTCTKCNNGYYVNSSKTCSKCTIANCAQCNTDGTCLSCTQGYYVSSDKKSCVDNNNKFNCSDSNFMQIGNLCITRINMGDSTMLPIPSTVNIATANTEYCYAQTSKCCWKGTTANPSACDSNNGGYDGCTRTVCNWDAANEICSKFTYGGKTWRLPTKEEMSNWAYNSIALSSNGLMLCDLSAGFSSARCANASRCRGSYDGRCYPLNVWSGSLSGTLAAYYYYLTSGVWNGPYTGVLSYAFSVRCVTEIE